MKCFHTKNYKGKALPTSHNPCLDCLKKYFNAHPAEPVTGEAAIKLIAAIESALDDLPDHTIQQIVSLLSNVSEW